MEKTTIDALLTPAAWPHPVGEIELVETHASWVFLTGEFAYKVKKPVDFGFLDFSSLEKRRHCCNEELRLNRRLAPDLYLEVVPIAGSPQVPEVGGEGRPFEYAVKMRQFDMDCGFDRMAQRGELGAAQVDATAEILARFHANAEVATEDAGFGSPDKVARPVLQNFEQIAPRIREQAPARVEDFEALERWSRAASERHAPVFARRLAGGFVRECHGDLHLRNIVWWEGQVMPFDCIEFNPALRWIDVMSELAFLLMDLDDHDLQGLSRRLLNAYLEYSGDFGGLRLLRFYQVYRAMVRAKVESLRLAQLEEPGPQMFEELENYLTLATGYTGELHPRLIIAHGLSGSGKTYASQLLLESAPLIRLRSDVERKRLFGLSPLDSSGSARDAGIYSKEANTRTYDHLAELATGLLESGWPVLVDAAFLKREEREQFQQLAHSLDVPFAIMHCEAEMSVQRQRVAARTGDASEAGLEVLDLQIDREEPLTDSEKSATIMVDTTAAPDLEGVKAFLEAL